MCKDLTDLTNKHGDRMGSKSANSVHPITKYKAKGMNGDTSRECGTLDFRMKPHDGWEVELNQPHVLEVKFDQPLVESRWCSRQFNQ